MFDVETNNWIDFEMAGVYDGFNYVQLNSVEDLVSELLSDRLRDRVIYAHNGGRFDFLFLLRAFEERNYQVKFIMQGARITALTVKRGKRRWRFQDSFALLPSSLDSLGKSFGTQAQKGSIDFDKEKVDKNNPAHQSYLERDCRVLHEVLTTFFSQPLIRDVKPRLTLAATAMAAWRTTLKDPFYSAAKTHAFIRKAYAGGRVEIFHQEAESGNCYDVNSLFPFVMATKPIPTELIGPAADPLDFGYHDVTIHVPEQFIPPLWVKTGKLIFPWGTWRGVYFSEEIKAAMKQGAKIIKFHKGYHFTARTDLFTEFVNFLYNERKLYKGTARDFTAKLLLNSCYGKFAERPEKKTLQRVDPNDWKTWPKTFTHYRSEAFFRKHGLIETKENRPAITAQVQIGAAITAWARIHMLEVYKSHGENLKYTDTDSIFTSQKADLNSDLGGLKEEYSYSSGYFLLPKAYFIKLNNGKYVKKIKGFPNKFLNEITELDFRNKNFKIIDKKIMTMKSSLVQNNEYLSRGEVTKQLLSNYTKRIVLPGGSTVPLKYEESKYGRC